MVDRMYSLCAQKPMQVTILHFNREELRHTHTLADFVDELERSRVYNSGAKRTLIQNYLRITQLAVVLTDLLIEVFPPDEMSRWDENLSQDEEDRIFDCKSKLATWYDTASGGLLPKKDLLESASENSVSEAPGGFAHDSVILYTNLMLLIYQ